MVAKGGKRMSKKTSDATDMVVSEYYLDRHFKNDMLRCFSCGICIGIGYTETIPFKLGDKAICGWCKVKIKSQGYIQLNSFLRLLPNGEVIKKGERLLR